MVQRIKRTLVADNHLTLKIGKWIEASATGPLGIGAIVALAVGYATLKALGLA